MPTRSCSILLRMLGLSSLAIRSGLAVSLDYVQPIFKAQDIGKKQSSYLWKRTHSALRLTVNLEHPLWCLTAPYRPEDRAPLKARRFPGAQRQKYGLPVKDFSTFGVQGRASGILGGSDLRRGRRRFFSSCRVSCCASFP